MFLYLAKLFQLYVRDVQSMYFSLNVKSTLFYDTQIILLQIQSLVKRLFSN